MQAEPLDNIEIGKSTRLNFVFHIPPASCKVIQCFTAAIKVRSYPGSEGCRSEIRRHFAVYGNPGVPPHYSSLSNGKRGLVLGTWSEQLFLFIGSRFQSCCDIKG